MLSVITMLLIGAFSIRSIAANGIMFRSGAEPSMALFAIRRPFSSTSVLLLPIPRKSAKLIAKTLKSAIANAENNNNLSADSLTIKFALIENGPVLKRFKAGARGTAMPRRKKMSHIRIVLTDGSSN